MPSSIVLDHLDFTWPDGSLALNDITASFSTRRTGLVGLNGSGKSTLLKLIAGLERPTGGSIQTSGEVGHLPQDVTLQIDLTVAELLGDRWDIETEAADALR
jgi:ATPase subunit of ABC transporter with duplicated ATPase domains